MPRKTDSTNQEAYEATPMPGLIVNQGTIDGQSSHKKTPREKILEHTNPNNASATRWMWICTIIITLAIAGVWGYGMLTQLSFFNWSSSGEAKLLKNTREQWNFFFTNQPTSTAGIKAEISNVINQIVASSTPATTEVATDTAITTTTVTATTTATSTF